MQASRNHPINCGLATSQFARSFAKQNVNERSGGMELIAKPMFERSALTVDYSENDLNLRKNIGTIVTTDIDVTPAFYTDQSLTVVSSQSSNVNVAAPTDDLLNFSYVSSGLTSITIEFNNGEKVAKPFITSRSVDASYDELLSFQSGTLARHNADQIIQRAQASDAYPQHLQVYSTFDFSNNVYVKNTACWASGLDFSGITVSRFGTIAAGAVSAITPYHGITAAHYRPLVGDTLFWCDSNNELVSRTVVAVDIVPAVIGNNRLTFDTAVVRFSEALPSTVAKYQTLPSNFADYAPARRWLIDETAEYSPNGNDMLMNHWPVIVTSHYNWAANWPLQRNNRYAYFYCTGLLRAQPYGVSEEGVPLPGYSVEDPLRYLASPIPWANNTLVLNSVPNINLFNEVASGIRGGDSGGPLFFVINNELVIITHHTEPASGRFYPSFVSRIQALIDTLGPGGQTFGTVDLSEFTNFAS